MIRQFRPHDPRDECHALPKPTRRKRGMVAACSWCGALHVCLDAGWESAMWVWNRLDPSGHPWPLDSQENPKAERLADHLGVEAP